MRSVCNLYQSTPRDKINLRHLVALPELPYPAVIAPLSPAPIVLARGASAVAQWGMIPPGSESRKPLRKTKDAKTGKEKLVPLSTNNARRETVAKAWTFRFPWARGQRCLIPADSYDEPYWGTGKNIWWRFWRADGEPWALAGIWNEWTDPATGEVVPNFTMLTQNCDGHPLLQLMHKPDGAVPPDKRAVVPIEPADWDTWLHGSLEQAEALIRVPPIEAFRHGAADPAKQVDLPIG